MDGKSLLLLLLLSSLESENRETQELMKKKSPAVQRSEDYCLRSCERIEILPKKSRLKSTGFLG